MFALTRLKSKQMAVDHRHGEFVCFPSMIVFLHFEKVKLRTINGKKHLFIFTTFQIEEKKSGMAYTLRKLEHQGYMMHLSLVGDGYIREYVI